MNGLEKNTYKEIILIYISQYYNNIYNDEAMV